MIGKDKPINGNMYYIQQQQNKQYV